MKITTFNPQIITKDAETVVQIFEALGFERRHTKEAIGDLNVTGVSPVHGVGWGILWDFSTPFGRSK